MQKCRFGNKKILCFSTRYFVFLENVFGGIITDGQFRYSEVRFSLWYHRHKEKSLAKEKYRERISPSADGDQGLRALWSLAAFPKRRAKAFEKSGRKLSKR